MDSAPASCNKKAWEKEINALLPDKNWRFALSRIHSCSFSSKHKLILDVSPDCGKYKSNDSTLLHSF